MFNYYFLKVFKWLSVLILIFVLIQIIFSYGKWGNAEVLLGGGITWIILAGIMGLTYKLFKH